MKNAINYIINRSEKFKALLYLLFVINLIQLNDRGPLYRDQINKFICHY
jgi:hypothetical protein